MYSWLSFTPHDQLYAGRSCIYTSTQKKRKNWPRTFAHTSTLLLLLQRHWRDFFFLSVHSVPPVLSQEILEHVILSLIFNDLSRDNEKEKRVYYVFTRQRNPRRKVISFFFFYLSFYFYLFYGTPAVLYIQFPFQLRNVISSTRKTIYPITIFKIQ